MEVEAESCWCGLLVVVSGGSCWRKLLSIVAAVVVLGCCRPWSLVVVVLGCCYRWQLEGGLVECVVGRPSLEAHTEAFVRLSAPGWLSLDTPHSFLF
jgi:hypothetical protein